MEKIDVQARFDSSGKAIPIRFCWQEQDYLVESIGRRWRDAQGLHILVQIHTQLVYELLYQAESEQWWLVKKAHLPLSA